MSYKNSKNALRYKIFSIFLFIILFFSLDAQAWNHPNHSIVWTPGRIEETLGFEGRLDIRATFVSSKKLRDVNLWVVPELQRFASLEQKHFSSIKPHIPYEVILHLSVPHGTRPGSYRGTVHLGVGKCRHAERSTLPQTLKIKLNVVYENVSIPSTTKVLDESTTQYLLSVSADGAILIFSRIPRDLRSLLPGDIIVIGITPATPNGLLRKVKNISIVNNQVVVETTQATLEDAIEKGSIEINRRLTPQDVSAATAVKQGVSLKSTVGPQALEAEGFYAEIDDVVLFDKDGDYSTTSDQIKAKGTISFDPLLVFNMEIEDFRLQQLTFANTITETAELEIKSEAEIIDIQKKVEIARYNLTPIIVWVGWVPVVITPILTINIGVDGDVSVGVKGSVTQEASLTAGLAFNNGTWGVISNFSNDFQFDPPALSAGCEVRGYAGPQLSLLLYGIAGPYGEIDGYLELDADILAIPWWELYGGLEAGVGVRVEVLSNKIADYYYPEVIGYRRLLAQAETPAPNLGVITGSVRDALTLSLLQNVLVDVYDQNSLIGSGTTDSNGNYSISVQSGIGYKAVFSKTGYLSATYYNVSVAQNTTAYLEAVLQIDNLHSGTGNVSGRILNAQNGTGVSGLTMNLREGINVTTGTILATTSTGGDGFYSFQNLNAGNYTAEVRGTGYNTTYFTITCIGGTTIEDQDAVITPILSSGETRIILTWGETPADLDSHLTGPLPDGTRFHMYYPYAQSNTGSPWSQYVTLDLDDVTSYGPETTTIYQQIGGVYRFSVHDYTNKESSSSTALSNSFAQVKVYRGSNLVATFNVPPNRGGTLWTVFELSGSTMTPVNKMSYESAPTSIQSFSNTGEVQTDAPLMMDLPPKGK